LTASPHLGAASDDALQADQVAQESGVEGSWRHMLRAEGAFKPDEKVLRLLGIGGVNAAHKFLKRPATMKRLG
jgi:hypothetical protein